MRAKRKHHELRAWQSAMSLVKDIYRITALFPKEEMYALTSQMRRAAVSIPSNIAEGAARGTDKEFAHFLHVARGSLSELETQLIIAHELAYVEELLDIEQQVEQIFILIGGLIKSIKGRTTA